MKFKIADDSQFDMSKASLMSLNVNKMGKPNLLETYLRIVKTGAPEEIEKFSQIER